MKTGIYKFKAPNGAVYVGQAKDIESRYNQHKWGKKWVNWRFSNSIETFGFDIHVFEIICECCISDLDSLERHYQDLYDVCGSNGLNCKLTATKDKPLYLIPETLKRMSDVKKGKVFTEDAKVNMAKAATGRKMSAALIEKRTQTRKSNGVVLSEEGRLKIINANLGHKYNVGRKATQETIARISQNSLEWHKHNLNPAAKTLFDLQTGIFYETLKEGAFAYNIKAGTLTAMMKGRNRNKTNLIYA